MKKILSILLAAALLLGLGTVGAGALTLPEAPKIEVPAAFPALGGAAARALTDEEIEEIGIAFSELLMEAYMTAMIKEMMLEMSVPIMLMEMFDDPSIFLKDGVDLDDLWDAFEAMLVEIDILDPDYAIMNAVLALLGLDDFPNPSDPEFEDVLLAIQAALEDGSLKAAIDGAVDAWYNDMLEALNAFDYAAYLKPEALDFLNSLSAFMELYMELAMAVAFGDIDLTDELEEALKAIFDAMEDDELEALLEEGKWDEAAALISEITAQLRQILEEYGLIDPLPVTYTLTYNANGGTGGPAAQANIAAGAEVTLATTGLPTRDGYTFKGWGADAAATATVTKVTVSADTTVYAVWEKLPEKSKFEQWKDKLADGKFGGIFKGLATWADFLLYIIYFVFFGWLGNIIVK